ncbi:MAG: hypothetical protein RRX93_06390 [Bacteroidales bacterium]
MKVKDLLLLLNAHIMCGEERMEQSLEYAFASDLMSDVLTLGENAGKKLLLITGLSNIQAIRTAEMSEIKFVLFVRGKKTSPEMIALAEENQMVLMESPYSMYRAAGLLWKAGLPPIY